MRPLTKFSPLRLLTLVCLLAAGMSYSTASGQELQSSETETYTPRPVLIVNLSSIERSLHDIARMFEISGRPDLIEVIDQFLGDKANGLKGIDHTRPVGYMIFLEPNLPPQPRMVMYIPVENEDEMIQTLEKGPGTISKESDHAYVIENGSNKTPLWIRGSDAFVLANGDEFLAGEELPSPNEYTTGVSARYDVSVTARLDNIPPLLREVFGTFFSQQIGAQLQQRDEESDAAYQMRRAQGLTMMKLMEQVVRDGEVITLGLDSTADGQAAVVELDIKARPESEFSQFITNIAGAPTYFEPLLSEQHPLQISVSWNTDAREREGLTGVVQSIDTTLRRELPPDSADAITQVTDSFKATIDDGHMDAIVQLFPQKEREFVLLAGVRVVGQETLRSGLESVLRDLNELSGVDTKLNAHQYQNVSLHKLVLKNANKPDMQRMYGGQPDLYAGVGNGVFWIGFGRDGVAPAIDHAIDATTTASPAARTASAAPFQLILRVAPWLTLPASENNGDMRRRELVSEAMSGSLDSLRVDVQPTENGGRVTLRVEEGFVRLVGLAFAQMYDRTQL